MIFTDPWFIFAFLPAAVLASALAGRISFHTPGIVLAVASLVFYSLWRVENLAIFIMSMALNYLCGRALLRRPSMGLLTAAVAVNLLVLGFFKYSAFGAENLGGLLGTPLEFDPPILPLAISFFTFQQIAYLVDCYRKAVDVHGALDYCLFVSFFPHLIAGPLVQPRDMLAQWHNNDLRPKMANLAAGATIFAVGLFKKLYIADSLAPVVDAVFTRAAGPAGVSMFEALLGTLGFTLQIYFDFSGYTDMAVGMAWVFGIRLPVNFASPYKATSIIDFWQRWHMTLSRFLRDYLYFPLGGNRRGRARQLVNVMAVMLLGGLWHGAAWTFVLWGAIHGAAIVVNHAWRWVASDWRWTATGWFRFVGGVVTFAVVMVAWVPFRAPSWEALGAVLSGLFGMSTLFPGGALPVDFASAKSLLGGLFMSYWKAFYHMGIGLLIVFLLPNVQDWMARCPVWIEDGRRRHHSIRYPWRASAAWGVGVGSLLFLSLFYMWQTQTQPLFIYFEF